MNLISISFFVVIHSVLPSTRKQIAATVKGDSSFDQCLQNYFKQFSALRIAKGETSVGRLCDEDLMESVRSYCGKSSTQNKMNPSKETKCDETLNEFIVSLLQRWEWRSLILIADQDVKDLVLALSYSAIASVVLHVDQTYSFEEDFYYHIETSGIRNIILMCKDSNIEFVIKMALKLNVFDRQYSWLSIENSSSQSSWSYLNQSTGFFEEERQLYSITKTSESDSSLPSYEVNRVVQIQMPQPATTKRFVGNYTKDQGLFLSSPFDSLFPLLRGYEVTVATFNDSLFMEVFTDANGTITTKGLISEILKIVQEKMGIRIKYVIRDDKIYGSIVNGTWNGVVGMVHRKEVDVGGLALFRTPERDKVVSYSPYLMKSSRVVFLRDPNADKQYSILYTLFLRPFDFYVWSLVILTWVTMSILMNIAYAYSPIENRCRFFQKISVTHIVYGLWCGLLQQGLEDVIGDGSYAIGTIRHTSLEETLKEAEDAIYRKVWQLVSKDLQRNLISDVEDAVKRVQKEKFALLYDWTSLHPFLEDCSLTYLPNRYMTQGVHVIFQKNSPWREAFSWYINHLRESGILSRLEREYFNDHRECDNKIKSNAVVTIYHVVGVLIALMIGVIGSCVCFCIEYISEQRRKHTGLSRYMNCIRINRIIVKKTS